MSFDKNTLLMKQHDLMQSRADCLEKATKAYESGNMADYDTHFAEVGNYNAELDKLTGLISECDKEFTASQAERLKSDGERDNHVTGLLMDQIRSTEKYAKAWIESIRKGLNPGTFRSDDVFAPLYEAERASKALTIGGGTTTGEDGGFLVPIDFETKVNALLKEYVDLSTLVTVERVNVNAGWRVFDASDARTKLSKIAEMGQISKDQQPKFKQVPYSCEKYGDKIIVSNELLADADGLMTYLAGWFAPKYANIYDDDRTIRCQWTGAFGTEAVTAYSLHQTAPATVTMRFDPRVTGDCVVDKIEGDRVTRYKIVTDPNDVGDAHRWLEFKVTRKGAAM